MSGYRDIRFEVNDGIQLAGDAWGDPEGPPVLFLHGGGQTRHAWKGTAQAMASAGWYAVAIDHRGHGESDWAPDQNYSLGAFVDDLLAVTREFRSPPALVGASLGGLTTILAAGEHGYRAAGCVLVDIAPRIEVSGARRIFEFMKARPDGFGSLEEAAELIASYTPKRRRKPDHRSLEKNLRRGEDGRYRWHWDPSFLGEKGPTELRDTERLLEAARNIAMPTLLVRGRESDVVSAEGAAEFLAALPDGQFVDVSEAGHMVAGDRNDVFTRAVVDFFAEKRRG